MIVSMSPNLFVTPEEYLAFDRQSDIRNEYISGEIVPVPASTERHGLILVNSVFTLEKQLRGGPCRVYSGGPRLCLDPRTLYVYPDVMVVCGPRDYRDDLKDTVTNPKLVAEVLSPSTRDYDLGGKASMYRSLPSLSELLLIEQDRIWIEHHRRLPNGHWDIEDVMDGDATLVIESVGIQIAVSDIYSHIAWSATT